MTVQKCQCFLQNSPLSIHFPLQSSTFGFPFSVLNENNNIAESYYQSITQLHISKTGKFVLVPLLLFIHEQFKYYL